MKKNLISPCLVLLMITGAMLFACSKSSSSGYGGNNNTGSGNAVSIKNMAFSITSLTVTAGTKVTWTNNDGIDHTVTADDGSFDSGNIAPGGTFNHTFSTAGTLNYHCAIHSMMKASVIVN